MRQEGLDPKGKVELGKMLAQIGFKAEAAAEYLMAAQMYEERGEKDEAVKLYELVLSMDESNPEAKRALYRLRPRSKQDIEEIVTKMGFESSRTDLEPTEAEIIKAETSEPEVARAEIALEPPKEERPEPQPGIKEEPREIATTGIEEQLEGVERLLGGLPEDLSQRRELAEFFSDEGLWYESFFEARAGYLAEPSVRKLEELLSILAKVDDPGITISFLLTESFAERQIVIQAAVLQALAKAYEEAGKHDEAQRVMEKLHKLEEERDRKKSGLRIIEEVPPLSEEGRKTQKGKRPPGPIQFI